SNDHTVRLWNSSTGEMLCRLEGHKGWTYTLAFSPDGKLIGSGNSDGTARLWEVATGRERHCFSFQQGSPRAITGAADNQAISVSFYPDGALFAVAHCCMEAEWRQPSQSAVVLWDTTSGKEVRRLPLNAREAEVSSLWFSSDARTICGAAWLGIPRW